MDSVLIVSNTNTTLGIISDLLQSTPFSRIVTMQNGRESRQSLLENDFDLVIIDSPLPDEAGDDLAIKAAEQTIGVILIVEQDKLYDINATVEDSGVFVLPKPVSSMFFYQCCKLLFATKYRIQKLEKQNNELMQKLSEVRTINMAKCLLIEKMHLTESQAHRYIEKTSMDKRQSRLYLAKEIIKRYEV